MKVLVWTVIPNHYQGAFFQALRAEGVDLKVCYYSQVQEDRLKMGWEGYASLPAGEQFVSKSIESLKCVADWRERIHVVPGCSDRFLRQLAKKLSNERVSWVHWNEPSHPGLRHLLGWPLKRWYGNLINRNALGAIGIGQRALDDFKTWGVRVEKMAMVPYSSREYDIQSPKEQITETFIAGRHPVFLFLGTLCKRKGIDILLKSFAGLTKHNGAEPVLILVGNDLSNGAYQRLAQSLCIEDRVLFRGPVPVRELGCILRCGDVLCLPSRYDGWGVVLNEAASMGLALIASNSVGAAMHLIEPSQNGFRVGTANVKGLRIAMQSYVKDSELAQRHGRNSLRLYKSYDAHRNAQRFVTAIQSLQAIKGNG